MMVIVDNAQKTYKRGKEDVNALDACNIKISRGDFISIMGPSGSGKSTLLKAISTSLELTSGEVYIDDDKVSNLSDLQKSKLRAEMIGYIVQDFMLLPNETVYENIKLPLIYNKKIPKNDYRKKIEASSEAVGISHLLQSKAKNLSGGESQRVAIARAIVANQELILADEPTGNLDIDNTKIIMELFVKANEELDKTIIIVTHDESVAKVANRHFVMKDGKLNEINLK